MTGTIHVIGGGIAGLAAATRLAKRGAKVVLYEATEALGGRCRSLHDRRLGRELDHGLHVAFSGHRHIAGYVADIGARDRFAVEDWAGVRFFDAQTRRAWTLKLNAGRIPWWILAPGRNAPGSGWADYGAVLRLAFTRRDRTLGELLGPGANRHVIWDPWCVTAIRAPPDIASVKLFKQALRNSFWRGGRACRLVVPLAPISAAYIEPAAAMLRARGAAIRTRAALAAIEFDRDRAVALRFEAPVPIGAEDRVVLAVTPRAAAALIPDLPVPLEACAAVTAHFTLDPPCGHERHLVCVLDQGPAWAMFDRDHATVTIASTDAPIDMAEDDLLARLWRGVALVLGRDPSSVPQGRVLRARYGSFAHTPEGAARRPPATTRYRNVFLAGDWIDHGHAASLDAAALSGHAAAALALP